MLIGFKNTIYDIDVVRKSARFLFMMGDSVRPIVQKPIVEQFIGTNLHQYALDAGCGRGLYTRIFLSFYNVHGEMPP